MPMERAPSPSQKPTPRQRGAELVALEDVLFVSDGPVPTCEWQRRRFSVPLRVIENGSTIHAPGDRGRLVLDRTVAERLDLL
jgi:hypothetical protein